MTFNMIETLRNTTDLRWVEGSGSIEAYLGYNVDNMVVSMSKDHDTMLWDINIYEDEDYGTTSFRRTREFRYSVQWRVDGLYKKN